jgi:hypothetical protein
MEMMEITSYGMCRRAVWWIGTDVSDEECHNISVRTRDLTETATGEISAGSDHCVMWQLFHAPSATAMKTHSGSVNRIRQQINKSHKIISCCWMYPSTGLAITLLLLLVQRSRKRGVQGQLYLCLKLSRCYWLRNYTLAFIRVLQ